MVALLAVRSPGVFSTSVAGALFENHWAYWLAGVVVGGILLITARSRDDRRLFKIGAGAMALALIWAAAALIFQTPGERLYAVHAAMADAAAKGDVDRLLSYMDRKFTIYSLNIRSETASAAAREEIGSRLKQLGIRQTHFTDYHVMLNTDGSASTYFVALTESENGLIKSQWQLAWNDDVETDWRVRDAVLEKLGDQKISPGDIVK